MGLHVGAIHVRTDDQQRVVEAIKRHWLGVGARPLAADVDPLTLEPLAVQKTGKLGYAVCPAAPDADGVSWVGVYDSERYHGSQELAQALADELDTLVLIYSFTGSVDAASLQSCEGATKRRSPYPDTDDWGEAESAVARLPYALIYFNQLKDAEEPPEGLEVFGFEGLPYREGREYRGPSAEELRASSLIEEVEALIRAGDLAAVRRAYEENPEQRYELLSKVKDSVDTGFSGEDLAAEEELGRCRTVVLGMAEELLADPSRYWRVEAVARSAFLTGDRALFARAGALLGAHVHGLESLALRLHREHKRDADAVEVLRLVTASEGASLTAFNNLAHCLCLVPELPADAAALLEACDAHGKANSYIFHNSACAWLRLGEKERALAAVRGAVEAGYPALEALRVDPDLSPLFADPRFAAAFETPVALDLADLVVTREHRKTTYVVQRPVLVMEYFLEPLGTDRVGPAIATMLEAYLAEIPADALQSTRRRGPWKKLTKGARTRDLNGLRNATAERFIQLDYRGVTDEGGGAPTEYGIHVEVWGESEDSGEHGHVPVVAVWFPAALAQGDVDAIAARFARYAAILPVEAGGCGLRVLARKSDYVETWWDSHLLTELRKRFLGSEQSPWREWSAGRAAGAMWLSLLGPALVEQLGGREALVDAVAPARVDELGAGVCIRASLRPGIGLAPRPADLGLLPRVARVLLPLTSRHEQAKAAAEAEAHYSRLLEIPDGPYENGPPVLPDPTLRDAAGAAGPRARPTAKPARERSSKGKPSSKRKPRA